MELQLENKVNSHDVNRDICSAGLSKIKKYAHVVCSLCNLWWQQDVLSCSRLDRRRPRQTCWYVVKGTPYPVLSLPTATRVRCPAPGGAGTRPRRTLHAHRAARSAHVTRSTPARPVPRLLMAPSPASSCSIVDVPLAPVRQAARRNSEVGVASRDQSTSVPIVRRACRSSSDPAVRRRRAACAIADGSF